MAHAWGSQSTGWTWWVFWERGNDRDYKENFQSNNFTEYSQNRKYFLNENFSEAPEGNLSVFTSGSTALVTLQNCSSDLKNGINI